MIVIPMAGLSQRFIAAGFRQPKYRLPLHGRSVFAHAVASFASYADRLPFLFIARPIDDTESFIRAEAAALGVADVRIVMLDGPTEGQAETVALGLDRGGVADNEPITIFNIDTFRPGFRFPDAAWCARSAGFLEVFEGEGANWSYVGPDEAAADPRVARTTEKQPISNLCCTGLYHFDRAGDLLSALDSERRAPTAPERYVAPLYNHLIAKGRAVHYTVVPRSEVLFCGVPAEFEDLRSTNLLGSPA